MTTELTATNGELVKSEEANALQEVLFKAKKLIYRSMRGGTEDEVDQLARAITGQQSAVWDHVPIELRIVAAVVMHGDETDAETGEVHPKTRLYLVDEKGERWTVGAASGISDFFTLIQLKGEPCSAKPMRTLWVKARCRTGRDRLSCTLPEPSPATPETATPEATVQAGGSGSTPTSTRSKPRAGSTTSG